MKAPTGKNDQVVKKLKDISGNVALVFYHGTSLKGAKNIIKDLELKPDDMGAVGLACTPYAAHGYATRKAKTKGVILELRVLKKELGVTLNELDKSHRRYFSGEIGGLGHDEILVQQVPLQKGWTLKLKSAKVYDFENKTFKEWVAAV